MSTRLWNVVLLCSCFVQTTPAQPVTKRGEPLVRSAGATPFPETVLRLAQRLPPGLSRYALVPGEVVASGERVDPDRLDAALRASETWIRAVLQPEFVPDDLAGRIQGVPSALRGVTENGSALERARYDCTTVVFDAGGYGFHIVQDSLSVKLWVIPLQPGENAQANDSDGLAAQLVTESERIFRHARVGYYLRGIRVNDFGVDLVTPVEAWYHQENRWKSNVLVPPQSCVEGRQDPMSELLFTGSERVASRMRELDPTLPRSVREDELASYWWGNIYAATDGQVLVYSVAKSGGGQSPGAGLVPDWFRVAEGEELEPGGSKGGQTRPTAPRLPPKE